MLHHIRPYRLFQHLQGNNDVRLTIPTVPGTESLTIFTLDTLLLIAAARMAKAKSFLEVGTSLGYTALHMAMNTESEIATIDIERKPCVFEGTAWEDRIARITQPVDEVFPEPNDMVFCDCNYTLDLCRQGAKLAFACGPKVIAFHDFGNPESEQHLHIAELAETRDIYHVEDTWMCFWFSPDTAKEFDFQ